MSLESSEAIRKKILAERRSLSKERVEELSGIIISRFLTLSQIQDWQLKRRLNVALYKAFPSELSLGGLESVFNDMDWPLFFPRVMTSGLLEFVEVPANMRLQNQSGDSPWVRGEYGVLEPHPGLKSVTSDCLDLVFVPGVAFGPHGERIGRGKGHYDRALDRVSKALRIALVFDFQIQAHLDQNPWDQPVHWVISEKREFRTPRVDQWFAELQK